ncbi:hypothetical protein NQ314_005945 [Rhamnusium bicolor]|uniref:BHLH domain-containing protein n=1 Tax=Rhamnusium bicolor TaxID=1586634 RepID=A0AAV8ZDA6_9CUCU|nr:hypothetical protein NQ314_005945 [Rhamnusium bicolor]
MKTDEATSKMVSESRKIRKPIMEKRRRTRINNSLETLKKILLENDPESRKSGQRSAKLEKADILEMTVRFLQHLKNKSNLKEMETCFSNTGNKDIQIISADSSTCECATGVNFGAHGNESATSGVLNNLINFPNSVANRTAYGALHEVQYLPVRYNSGGGGLHAAVFLFLRSTAIFCKKFSAIKWRIPWHCMETLVTFI